MSEYFEIAYAVASKRICLFTGTGFSKAVTDDEAPSWQGLLKTVIQKCDNPDEIQKSLFPLGQDNPLSLEEAAQVINTRLLSNGKNIHDEIATVIEKLTPSPNIKDIKKFIKNNRFLAVTTNYDYLLEDIAKVDRVVSIVPGLPIPQSNTCVKVYHVHGSIKAPQKMVVTTNDYFEFMGRETYFSRKLSTVLHENTVVILGYSLGDANLKAIINEYRGFSKTNFTGSNIFMVSRENIDDCVKDYYQDCYGIRVIDSTELDTFFMKLNAKLPEAYRRKNKSDETLQKVLNDNHFFKSEYLKIEFSFYEIMLSISAQGLTISDKNIVKLLSSVIEKKIDLTKEPGAWNQYEQLARWLVYLASKFDLKDSGIENVFLKATEHSMKNMSKSQKLGYSWHAFKAWNNKWSSISAVNRDLIRKYARDENLGQDALSVVEKS